MINVVNVCVNNGDGFGAVCLKVYLCLCSLTFTFMKHLTGLNPCPQFDYEKQPAHENAESHLC